MGLVCANMNSSIQPSPVTFHGTEVTIQLNVMVWFHTEIAIYQSWFIAFSVQRTAVMRWSHQSGMCMTYLLTGLPEDAKEFLPWHCKTDVSRGAFLCFHCYNASVLAMELIQSYTKPSMRYSALPLQHDLIFCSIPTEIYTDRYCLVLVLLLSHYHCDVQGN